MMNFLYHLPETIWKTVRFGVCLAFVYIMMTSFILPGLARMLGN